MNKTYDVIIIGAGPAGLSAAIYTGRARLNTLILEKGIPGGQILLTDLIENYPGFPDGAVPFELMGNFRKQAERFGAKIEMDEAKKIQAKDGLWHVMGNKGESPARSVIIATGSLYRKLCVENEGRLTGRGVSYCATCDGAFFKDKEIAVVGGGDWALTEALFLTKFCKTIKIIHRRDELRGEKILQERAFKSEKIEVIWDSVVEKISGKERLESLTLKNVKTGEKSELRTDGLFVSIGMIPNTKFIEGFTELDNQGRIKVKKDMATSQPGIYGAGDVTDACPDQMAIAVGSGVIAAIAVNEYLSK